VNSFDFKGKFWDIQPYGYGHINETYCVRFLQHSGQMRRYILQRINHNVFRNPAGVMHNYSVITEFLREKIIQAGGDPWRETINLVPLKNGDLFLRTKEGEFWRAEEFIENAQTYQFPTRPEHLFHAAWAFGHFGCMLADFNVDQLFTTIPDFHHTPKRFQSFLSALESDVCNRAHEVSSEIDFILTREADTRQLIDLHESGSIPARVTHNDTKFENVMMDDQTGKGICVIDLDTVMPGIILFDFGDTVRSSASTSAEDEPDLRKVNFNLDIFEQLARGYLDAARNYLLPIEIDHLAFAARLITLEQGIRFMTDYLNGDIYYRIHYPGQNLDRCRTQLKLVHEMETCYEKMLALVDRYR
jgi:thiamine kinase-like enzyme